MRFKIILVLAALLIVLLVIATLSITSVGKAKLIAKPMAAKVDLQAFKIMLDMYKTENGFYPTTQQGLDVLVNKPESSPIPQRWTKHLPNVPNDPWNHPYAYHYFGSATYMYDLSSLDPDGLESDDDIRLQR
jgi:general secretion pathway protein G